MCCVLSALVSMSWGQELEYGDAPEYDPKILATSVLYTDFDLLPFFPTVINFEGDDWYIAHENPFSKVFLGQVVSFEDEPLVVDRDDDDGLLTQELAPFETQGVELLVTIPPDYTPETPIYLNALFDWSQNGAWAGSVKVQGVDIPEWAIQNLRLDQPPYNLKEPGVYRIVVAVTAARGGNVWARFTVTTEPVPVSEETGEWHGQGQFSVGETEDWIVSVKVGHRGLGIPKGTPLPRIFRPGFQQAPPGPASQRVGDPLPPGERDKRSKEIKKGNNGVGNGIDPQPPGNPPCNDCVGTGPGNPGNKGGPEDKAVGKGGEKEKCPGCKGKGKKDGGKGEGEGKDKGKGKGGSKGGGGKDKGGGKGKGKG